MLSRTLISCTRKIDVLELLQNSALRIITGAVKTTTVAALQQYAMNPPIYEVIKKQARQLDDNDGEISMDYLKILVSPFRYMDIDLHLTLDGISKKYDNEAILKSAAQSIMEENTKSLNGQEYSLTGRK
ncbi:hypothetical protein CEXT_616771 [Caerostris extrusa]|uniref:Uncharacterized protein n=1 Tax=Caerostris extrusa TaxID=172846 RepID=A0AAV4MNU3_CAEEX|nr:hypothetical protein CEXT_616771 [Caerostris extrusa]